MHVPAHFCGLCFKCQFIFKAFALLFWSALLGCDPEAKLKPGHQSTHSSVCCVDYGQPHGWSAQRYVQDFIHRFKESCFPVLSSNSHPVTSWEGAAGCLFAAVHLVQGSNGQECTPSQSPQRQVRGQLRLLVLVQAGQCRQGSIPQAWPEIVTMGMRVAFFMAFTWSSMGFVLKSHSFPIPLASGSRIPLH